MKLQKTNNTIAMGVIILLLGASLTVALGFLAAFIWSVKHGQFEDDFSPAHRMLFEDKVDNSKD
ncbi:cbb3-type cytochrome oxidase assembly protein CcoS [Chitinophaga sp.]|nr:cbb3-type cytochrome oxidase assembly protein CcoS [Chitinophaga sp.]